MNRPHTFFRVALAAALLPWIAEGESRAEPPDTDSLQVEEPESMDEQDDMERPGKPLPVRRRTIEALLTEVRHPPRPTVFHPPPSSHFEILQQVMRDLSAAAQTCEETVVVSSRRQLAPIAMEIERLRQKGTTYLVVRERPSSLRGNGIYVLRCGDAAPLALQAPHSYFDLNTATVAYKAFRKLKARFLLMNTVQRYRGRQMEVVTDDAHPADMAHNPRGMFQAAHLGMLAAAPQTLFVQLHGFDSSWRDVDVVLSDGRVEPQVFSQRLANAWKDASLRIAVFGRQFQGLGAMTNSQAQATHAVGGRFLHIELSLELRREMVRGGRALRRLCNALLDLVSEPQ